MAKILDVLKKVEAASAVTSTETEPVSPILKLTDEEMPDVYAELLTLVDEDFVEETVDEEEPVEKLFFIEVGGRSKPIDGSPEVLALFNQPADEEDEPNVLPATAAPLAKMDDPVVDFQPWPARQASVHPDIVVYHNPDDALSHQYHRLFQQLHESAGEHKVWLFTAPTEDEGAATPLLNLAFAAARDSERQVAIVDLNGTKPTIAQAFGITTACGLAAVLAGSAALDSALHAGPIQNLRVLPFGETVFPNSAALSWIMQWLRERFDLVLIHGPAWEQRDTATASLIVCDNVFPVIQKNTTTEQQLQHMVHEITSHGGCVRGIVFHHLPQA